MKKVVKRTYLAVWWTSILIGGLLTSIIWFPIAVGLWAFDEDDITFKDAVKDLLFGSCGERPAP